MTDCAHKYEKLHFKFDNTPILFCPECGRERPAQLSSLTGVASVVALPNHVDCAGPIAGGGATAATRRGAAALQHRLAREIVGGEEHFCRVASATAH